MKDTIGEKTLAFLAKQRLPAEPRYYALAYHCITGENDVVAKAVRTITDDGVRITRDEADAIMSSMGIGGSHTQAQAENKTEDAQHIVHAMLSVADLASGARDETLSFRDDLRGAMPRIASDPAMATLVDAMIARVSRAENALANTATRMEEMRGELEAARSDAHVDTLTGLANRRAIDAHLADLTARGRPRSIAICDVDRFKSINDRYGHVVGDRVLKAIANAISTACPGHLVGRWGGEEFVVIMEGVDEATAVGIVDQARIEVTKRHYKLRESDEPLGLVSFSAGVSNAKATDEATRIADLRLYAAKNGGRNQVVGTNNVLPLAA